MKTLYLMVGISASGKSTFAEKMAAVSGIPRISSDDIRGELCNGDMTDQSKNYQVFQTVYRRIADALQKGDAIADATNKSIKERKEYRKIALDSGAQIVAIVMTTNLEMCLEANAVRDRVVPVDVIHRQFSQLVQPSLEEVSDIVYVDWKNNNVFNASGSQTVESFLTKLNHA